MYWIYYLLCDSMLIPIHANTFANMCDYLTLREQYRCSLEIVRPPISTMELQLQSPIILRLLVVIPLRWHLLGCESPVWLCAPVVLNSNNRLVFWLLQSLHRTHHRTRRFVMKTTIAMQWFDSLQDWNWKRKWGEKIKMKNLNVELISKPSHKINIHRMCLAVSQAETRPSIE